VRGCQSRASARSRGNFTEHPQDRQNTRLTAVHREVRPSRAPPARSPRRVRARGREQIAFNMRFRVANPWINRSWVNCDQVSFWFQKQKTTFQIHHIALSANALFRLTLPRIEIRIRSGQFEAQTGKVTSGVMNNGADQAPPRRGK